MLLELHTVVILPVRHQHLGLTLKKTFPTTILKFDFNYVKDLRLDNILH